MDNNGPAPREGFSLLQSVKKAFNMGRSESAEEVEEDILSMVTEGQEIGAIEEAEAEMITNIFALNDKEAGDVMTNRSLLSAIECGTTLHDALDIMLEGSNSRYPVYDENLDCIVGILYLKDAFRISRQTESENKPVSEIPGLLRPVFYVAETKKIDDLFREMQQKKVHMVIVIDEYGQTAGLVTMEDILEEIFGNIMDEYDPEEAVIEDRGTHEYVVEGSARLEDLAETLEVDFSEEEFETINGFIISRMDHIPAKGEAFETVAFGYLFRVLEADNNRVEKVLIKKAE